LPSLKHLRQAKVPLAVPVVAGYDEATGKEIEDTINVVYYAHVYDKTFERKAAQLYESFKADDDVIVYQASVMRFLHVVASWDLKADDDDDAPIPLTEEAINAAGVTQDLMEDILTAVTRDRAPKAKARRK
jgi:hypothetical protein